MTTYDGLGRLTRVQSPTAAEYSAYSYPADLQVRACDGLNHCTTTTHDLWGRVAEVRPAADPWLQYTYDEADRLKTVEKRTGSGGGALFATTTMNYDLAAPRGPPKTSMSDPDLGSWSYTYNAAHNLTGQSDARGCTTSLSYDGLSRVTQKSYSGSCGVTTSAITYGYDAFTAGSNLGRGQRTSMSDGSGNTTWTYGDARGRLTRESKTISGSGTFVTQWSYDSADQVTSLTYPDGEVVAYTYLTQRLVNSVGGNSYVQASLYDAAGRLTERRLGVDQLRTGYTYYAWSSDGGRLQFLKTGTPATYNGSNPSLQYFQYDYDHVGNVNWVRDHKATGAAQTHQFTYDALDRVVTASATNASGGTDGGLYSESYAYNANGLMTTGPLGAGYTYGNSAHKHAVTSVGGNTFTYDANGNMTGRTLAGSGASTLTYDGENRLVGVNGAASASFGYDGDNGRVKGSVNGATTTYVGAHYEVEQLLCTGQTTVGSTNWQVESSTIIRVDVDTSSCELGSTPLYFSSLGGSSGHWLTVGATSIYYPTATGFRIYLRFADGGVLTPATANTNGWHMRWAAVGRETATTTLCSGRTAPGATNWQVYGSNGVYLDVNTSRCGYGSTPVYLTSLGGNSSHFATTGATSIYVPTATGFRVYVRIVSGANFTPADANSWGWHLNWLALPNNQTGATLCTGQSTSSGWVAYSSGCINGLYRDVSTGSCGNGSRPHYLTSLGGSSSHWGLLGMSSVYLPTATGFRVYIRDWSNSVLTPPRRRPTTGTSTGWRSPAAPPSCASTTTPATSASPCGRTARCAGGWATIWAARPTPSTAPAKPASCAIEPLAHRGSPVV